MLRKTILCALAGAALIPSAVAAHPGGGGGGGGGPSGMGGAGNMGGFGNSGMGGFGNNGMGGFDNGMGSSMRDQGRMNSRGPANASAVGIDHSDRNSVLFGTSTTKTISTGTFAGLKTGTTLFSNGTAVGTVQQIRTNASGTPVVLVIKGTNGGFYAVPVQKLSFSGGTLSTTARLAGINNTTTVASSNQARLNSQGLAHASATGIAHANSHSVLASTRTSMTSQARLNSQGLFHASTTGIAHANSHSVLANGMVVSGSLAGLTTGQTVKTSGGTTLGTVSQVVTGSDGSIRLVVVTSSTGQTFRLLPTSLSIGGGVVTTTQKIG